MIEIIAKNHFEDEIRKLHMIIWLKYMFVQCSVLIVLWNKKNIVNEFETAIWINSILAYSIFHFRDEPLFIGTKISNV